MVRPDLPIMARSRHVHSQWLRTTMNRGPTRRRRRETRRADGAKEAATRGRAVTTREGEEAVSVPAAESVRSRAVGRGARAVAHGNAAAVVVRAHRSGVRAPQGGVDLRTGQAPPSAHAHPSARKAHPSARRVHPSARKAHPSARRALLSARSVTKASAARAVATRAARAVATRRRQTARAVARSAQVPSAGATILRARRLRTAARRVGHPWLPRGAPCGRAAVHTRMGAAEEVKAAVKAEVKARQRRHHLLAAAAREGTSKREAHRHRRRLARHQAFHRAGTARKTTQTARPRRT